MLNQNKSQSAGDSQSDSAAVVLAHLEKVRKGRNLSFHDFITVEDITAKDIRLLFEIAAVFKAFIVLPHKKIPILKGKSIINLFFESSTRTKISFELGGKHLGADTINFSSDQSSQNKGETIGDTARTLNSMNADLLICRSAHAGIPNLIINEIDCPIINAGDGWHEHPTQALFDAFTVYEHFKTFKNLNLCIIGDILHSRVAGSLMRLTNMLDMNLHIVAPQTFLPENMEQFTKNVYYDLDEILPKCDVLYALRVQGERGAGRLIPSLREYSKCYGINKERLEKLKKNSIVMHAGPVMREIDLATEVLDSPKCKVNDQVTNGFAMRMALMWLLTENYHS